MIILEDFSTIVSSCQNSKVGKKLPNALYVHLGAINALDPLLQDYEARARKIVGNLDRATIVKFSIDRPKISYLYYPDFDRDPHPRLHQSTIVDLGEHKVSQIQYQDSQNPPILHRKETFVTPRYPLYREFRQLTQEEVTLGLLDKARHIGTFQEWQRLLKQQRLDFAGHHLICPIDPQNSVNSPLSIDRHKAALPRKELSRPVRIALEAELFTPGATFFDYGCGYGVDWQKISELGYESAGWDPYYLPDAPLQSADIVNLGYVINVIEDFTERQAALIKAWELTREVLIVSAQVLIDDLRRGLVAFGDGVLTNRNTFQKYYEQEELKIYIDRILKVDSIPVSLGVYLVFRDEARAETFRASRFFSRVRTPRIKVEAINFEDYRELLTPLMDFYAKRGRLPVNRELPEEAAIKDQFGTYNRAFKLILQATDRNEWDAIAEQRRQDLLVYLALSKFGDRPSIRKLSPEFKADVQGLFGSYKEACLVADMLLLNVGDLSKIANLCKTSSIGKQLNHALAIHISALEKLPPLLRLYEGCASRNFNRLEAANVIKFYYNKPKISYLVYEDFDLIAHPTLQATLEVDLQNLAVIYHDISDEYNPVILHRKDALVAPDYHLYDKFARLTKREEKLGLLNNLSTIGRLRNWSRCLNEKHLKLEGHNLTTNNSRR
jgi:DNA phosphorothioation-associated putative methyltransferase